MKKIIFLTGVLTTVLTGKALFGQEYVTGGDNQPVVNMPDFVEPGFSSTPILSVNNGSVSIYYDDTVKSMCIRFIFNISGTSLQNVTALYCYKNVNPDLYNSILMFCQKSMDGWATSCAPGTYTPGNNSYRTVIFWYKLDTSGKYYIKGMTWED
jgi:hypothetical protein